MNNIIILLDYLNSFYSKDKTYLGIDKNKLEKYFNESNINVTFKKFSDIRFRNEIYKNNIILYQSSEDTSLRYKSYIDDILYGLLLQGAILIPDYKYFKAHHNKVFAEILRDLLPIEEIKNIHSEHFGTIEEYEDSKIIKINKVFKTSEGALSTGVRLLSNENEATDTPRILSQSKEFKTITLQIKDKVRPLTHFIKRLLGIRIYLEWESKHRNKFILQNYISELKQDYKVLVFGKKYYLLERNVRENDFRASGSGNYKWPIDPNYKILNFAQTLFEKFKVPFASFDIAIKGEDIYLIEFQFIMFGTITMERSEYYFIKESDKWKRIEKKSELEEETALSVTEYLKLNNLI